MQHVEAFLVLQFEVDVGASDQHVDDVLVLSSDCIMQRRVTFRVLRSDHHHHHLRINAGINARINIV